MSDFKYLILDGTIIEKIEEIRRDLRIDIREEEHKEKLDKETREYWETRYGKSYPYECLLEEIEELLIKYQKSYVSTSFGMDVDDIEIYSLQDYIKERFPDWEHIYDETDFQKRKRELEEFKNRVTN